MRHRANLEYDKELQEKAIRVERCLSMCFGSVDRVTWDIQDRGDFYVLDIAFRSNIVLTVECPNLPAMLAVAFDILFALNRPYVAPQIEYLMTLLECINPNWRQDYANTAAAQLEALGRAKGGA